jgi:hypothetical protein
VRAVRLGRRLVALLVDAEVARGAAVGLGRRAEDHVVVQVRRQDLVDLQRRVELLEDRQVAHEPDEAAVELAQPRLEAPLLGQQQLALGFGGQARLLQLVELRLLGGLLGLDALALQAMLLELFLELAQVAQVLFGAARLLVHRFVVLVTGHVDLRLREAEVLVGRVPLGALQVIGPALRLADRRGALLRLLLSGLQLGLDRAQALADLLVERVDLRLGQLQLEVVERDLVLLPLARVVEPDHQRQRDEQRDRGEREQDVQLERPLRHLLIATGLGLSHG